ncbi:MAG: hypothetical protein J6W70_04375, partial [Lentisphaeria bacterium]|nr:hypothetical protein [Lentisphaeria bacterium]
MFFSKDSNHERSWWYYVGWATVVQVLLIILCFIVRIAWNVIAGTLGGGGLLAAVILIFLYLPGVIVIGGSESIHVSASAGWILLLFSFAFYSVLFGSLFYFGHRYIRFLRSDGADRPYQPLSEPEPETWDEQGETSTDAATEESAEELDEAEDFAESEPAADPPKNRGMRWLRCVIVVTAVQPVLLLLCLVAPDSLLAAGIMTYFYIPARLLVDGFGLPAPVVLILFLLSVVVFSVFFGSVVCFGGPLVKRMLQRASAFKRRVRGRPGKKSSNCEYDGGVKWGCCISVLIALQPLLFLCSLLDDGGLRSLYIKYVYQPAEWLLPVSRQHYTDMDILPVVLFLLFVVGTFYSVLFGSL